MPTAELVVIGSELLLGTWADTNGPWLARELRLLGLTPVRKWVVGDDETRIADAVGQAAREADLVLLTGGLGPTEDDRTRAAVARAAGVPLEFRPELLQKIEAVFRRFGVAMPASNRVQAEIPRGAEAIPNPWGTAPGFALELGRAWVVALPGVPRELKNLFRKWVAPRIRERFGGRPAATRVLRLSGLGESAVGDLVRDLMLPAEDHEVTLLSSPGEVKVVITARGPTERESRALVEDLAGRVRERLHRFVFGTDDETHALVALRAVEAAGWTLASAEGWSAGTLASWLREAGHPAFRGGMVLGPGAGLGREDEPAGRCLGLAREAAERFGAQVGVALFREDELLPHGGTERLWIGASSPGGQKARAIPVVHADASDAQRACHQALYAVRRLAGGGR